MRHSAIVFFRVALLNLRPQRGLEEGRELNICFKFKQQASQQLVGQLP
jgi:hypothetical protein